MRAPPCSTSASPTSTSRARCPAPIHIPRGHLEAQVEGRLLDKTAPVVVYCAGGVRSAFAAKTLQELGYTDVVVDGRRLRPVEGRGPRRGRQPVSLSAEQRNRYKRHLLLPEVGVAGQAKLLDSKVLMLGAGGLGSPAALYLAAAGVGTIGIVDMDEVDASQPAAPDPAQPRPHRRPQGRLGEEDADAAQPRRQRRHLRHPPRRPTTSSTSSPATT